MVSSGNHIKSYLTVATSSVPLDGKPLPHKSLKPADSETLQLNRVYSTNNFVAVSYKMLAEDKKETTGTYVMEVKDGGKMIPVDAERAAFSFDEESIAVFETKKGKYTVQVTLSSIRLIDSTSG